MLLRWSATPHDGVRNRVETSCEWRHLFARYSPTVAFDFETIQKSVVVCRVPKMFSRRYTVIVADRTSGVVRRVTISLRPLLLSVFATMTLPVLIGMGAAWKAKS